MIDASACGTPDNVCGVSPPGCLDASTGAFFNVNPAAMCSQKIFMSDDRMIDTDAKTFIEMYFKMSGSLSVKF